ncbi:three-prime repair exonuclease 1-like [Actinia tenebrosa]|uniref:Three-prime repair exonuclease 1-like n=1 Tax=Actinia tenebrosa TaxID=6105 RepID=A0A6P8HAU0_ACTTE|nr:three-prime repair exonuclease 1-like [Actinia tenebrosa]
MYILRRVVWSCRSFSRKMHKNTSFKSFIFFDLETTGLQRPIEITELCFIAIHKKQLLLSSLNSKKTIPRLVDKMSVCVRPVQDIEPGAESLTGLSNEDLDQHKGFNEELAKNVLSFILRQPQPSCLVAHSGDRFDFEILASEFAEVGLEFPPHIKVSDSYKAFKNLHQETVHPIMRRGEECSKHLNVFTLPKKVSFSLGNLYERQFGKEITDSHTAEGDSLALLELVVAKPEVLDYLEEGSHSMGCGSKNPGLSEVRTDPVKENGQHANKGKESCSKTLAVEIHEEYFGLLEKEGLLDNIKQ